MIFFTANWNITLQYYFKCYYSSCRPIVKYYFYLPLHLPVALSHPSLVHNGPHLLLQEQQQPAFIQMNLSSLLC
jgi:hypothetical protein